MTITMRGRFVGAATLGLLLVCGCSDKLTRDNYDMIALDSWDRTDVEETLGAPTNKLDDRWHYERADRHLNVFVHFDDMGIVSRKQWIGATDAEWHDTNTPPDDQSHSETTTIRTRE